MASAYCLFFFFLFYKRDFFLKFFWLHRVFIAVHRLSLAVVSGGHSSLWCLSLVAEALGLCSAGSVVVAHGLRCFGACGIFLDQGWSLHFLHWQMDSQPLDHQEEGPYCFFQRVFSHFHCLYVCFPLCMFHIQISLREKFCLGSLHPDEMAPTLVLFLGTHSWVLASQEVRCL